MGEHRQSHDVGPAQVRSARSVTRRHLLKLSAAGALGVGAANASSVASCGSKVGLSTSLPKPRVIGKKLVVAGLPAAPRMA